MATHVRDQLTSALGASYAVERELGGDRDAALTALERGAVESTELSAAWLRADPFRDPVRSDPRFQRPLVEHARGSAARRAAPAR